MRGFCIQFITITPKFPLPSGAEMSIISAPVPGRNRTLSGFLVSLTEGVPFIMKLHHRMLRHFIAASVIVLTSSFLISEPPSCRTLRRFAGTQKDCRLRFMRLLFERSGISDGRINRQSARHQPVITLPGTRDPWDWAKFCRNGIDPVGRWRESLQGAGSSPGEGFFLQQFTTCLPEC